MDRANIQAILPLTGPQEAILLHGLQGAGDRDGLIQVRFRIEGALDVGTYEAAWNDVMARHDGLRATVQTPKTQKAMLLVAKAAPLAVAVHDLSAEADQEARMVALISEDRQTALPLNEAPVSRVTLFQCGPTRFEALWTTQKILVDGWSAILVLQDVMARYRARRMGGSDGLRPVPPLKAYHAYLNAQDTDAAEAFWAEYRAGLTTAPLFRAGPGGHSAEHDLTLPEGLWPNLEAAATRAAVTPTALISAAWAMLLHAGGAGEDVGFALSLSGRSVEMPGHDTLVGPFATTAPRCVRLEGQTVAEIAQAIHRTGLTAQAHQTLAPHRMFGGLSADTLLTVETLPDADIAIDCDGGVALEGFQSDVASKFPVTLVVIPGARAQIRVSTHDLLNADAALSLLQAFPQLLADVAADPARSATEVAAAYASLAPAPVAATQTKATPPRTSVEYAIAEIWKDVLGVETIDMARDFVSHGGRSFAAMQILARVEAAFGKKIPVVDFIQAQTVPDLAQLLTREIGQGAAWQTLVPFRMGGARRPILFVHLGPHPVAFLKPLVDRIGPEQPFFAVQPVGVMGEGQPHFSFKTLAKLHVDEYLAVAPEGPVDLVGHCGGARLAMEVARQLKAAGRDIANFIVIDTHPPVAHAGLGVATDRQKMARSRFYRFKPLHFTRGAYRKARRGALLGWARATGNEELRREVRVSAINRACTIADNSYRADRYEGEIVVLHSKDSPETSGDWDPVVSTAHHKAVDVGHYTMFFEPDIDVLWAEIERWRK